MNKFRPVDDALDSDRHASVYEGMYHLSLNLTTSLPQVVRWMSCYTEIYHVSKTWTVVIITGIIKA